MTDPSLPRHPEESSGPAIAPESDEGTRPVPQGIRRRQIVAVPGRRPSRLSLPLILTLLFLLLIPTGLIVNVTHPVLPVGIALEYATTVDACWNKFYRHESEIMNRKLRKEPTDETRWRVWVVDDTVCVGTPYLDADVAREFEKAVINAPRPITRMMISSGGGDVQPSLRMARLVRDRGLALYPSGFCLGTCASMIFLAAKEKYYGKNEPFIAFDGLPKGPGQHRNLAAWLEEFSAELGGIDKRADTLPCNLRDDPLFREIQARLGRDKMYWVFPPQELERGFGVTGLKYNEDFEYQTVPGTWRHNVKWALKNRGGFVGLASCPPDGVSRRPP
jgi:hypothetical protein